MAYKDNIPVHGVPTDVWVIDPTAAEAETSAAASALRAEAAAEQAEASETQASNSEAAASKSAETAKQYSGNPPRVSDHDTWETWDAASGTYKDTGEPSRGRTGPSGPGTGDMLAEVYDPQSKAVDVYQYTDDGLQRKPNPNLLLNWYFGRPVNRNGLSEYVANATNTYTIDRFYIQNGHGKLTIGDGKITFVTTGTAEYLVQITNERFYGETLTVSALLDNGELISATGKNTLAAHGRIAMASFDGGYLQSYSYGLGGDIYKVGFCLGSQDASKPIGIIATKLERGPVQTLAHLEDGNWVLNEIPNYAEQYALCEQYSPITGEWVGSQHSNPNLLDNWYFVGGGSQKGDGSFPINQRGQTEYAGNGYKIDRWTEGREANLVVSEDSVTITGSATQGIYFYELIENYSELKGKTVTFSVMYSCETPSGDSQITLNFSSSSQAKSSNFEISSLPNILSVTTKVPDSTTRIRCIIGDGGKGYSIKLYAAKLELGPVQTLAHKEGDTWVLNDPPPNYQQELEKCQRYQINLAGPENYGVIGTSFTVTTSKCQLFIPLPVTLRARPTVEFEGTWKLASDASASNWNNGIKVDNINAERVTKNGVDLRVEQNDGNFVAGTTYGLSFCNSAPAPKLILDANL